MERVRAVLTPQVMDQAKHSQMEAVLAEVLKANPDDIWDIQKLHRRYVVATVAYLTWWGSIQPAYVRVLVREMLTTQEVKPLEIKLTEVK